MFGLFFSIVLLSSCVHKTRSKMEGFIVGGSYSQIETHPHSAFLEISCPTGKAASSWICGASVLNQQFALTAAHCVYGCTNNGAITVVVGNERRTKGSMTTALKIKSHEYYNDDTLVNDIALIMVRNSFRLSDKVQRVILMKNPPVSKEAVVAGWGVTDEIKGTGTLLLKHAKQTILSRNECAKALGERLDNRLLCAGSWRGNDYAAAGDSGSALMIRGYIQIGLVSHKYSRISRSIVLYTDVSYHYDWIVKNTFKIYCYSKSKNQL